MVFQFWNWCFGGRVAEKLLYSSEKFDAKLFLSHVHQNTAAADFQGAEEGLKEDLKLRNNELKKLVKENFDCFISCKNTIDGKCDELFANNMHYVRLFKSHTQV